MKTIEIKPEFKNRQLLFHAGDITYAISEHFVMDFLDRDLTAQRFHEANPDVIYRDFDRLPVVAKVEALEELGLSEAEVAEKVGVSEGELKAWKEDRKDTIAAIKAEKPDDFKNLKERMKRETRI